MKLGLNGFGRIGKLTVWHHVARKFFEELVVNLGRDVGLSLHDIAHYLERDSTYGSLGSYLHGHKSGTVIEGLKESEGRMVVDGTVVRLLRRARNPREIDWKKEGVHLVVDATGNFLDPTLSPVEGKKLLSPHRLR